MVFEGLHDHLQLVGLLGSAALLLHNDLLLPPLRLAVWALRGLFLVLQGGDVLDDVGHSLVVLHHFLVVAATLVRRARAHLPTDHHVDLRLPPDGRVCLEEVEVLFEEGLVPEVLLEQPVADVDNLPLLFDLIQAPSLVQHLLPVGHHLVLTFTLRTRVRHLRGRRRTFTTPSALLHY